MTSTRDRNEQDKSNGPLLVSSNTPTTQQEIDTRIGKELLNLGLIDPVNLAKIV